MAVIVPAWVLRPMTIDQEVGAPSTVTSEQGTSPQPTTVPPTAPGGPNVVMNPANGHLFEAVAAPAGITWEDARGVAASRTLDGIAGHLATFTSADEYLYIVEHLPHAFESGPDRNPYWIGGFQPNGSDEPAGGWTWVTGEPFIYAPWGSSEPNDSVSGENCLHPHHDPDKSPGWNDQPCDDATVRGYLVEYEPAG